MMGNTKLPTPEAPVDSAIAKAATILAIQKRAKKATDGGKTAAMKSLSAGTATETAEDVEAIADAPVTTPYVRPTPPPPPLVRKPPVVVSPPVYVRRVVEEPVELDIVEELPPSGKVAFDPVLWQWRDEGGFVHIKTGELREESEFIDPDEKTHDDSGEWDEPQTSGDDW